MHEEWGERVRNGAGANTARRRISIGFAVGLMAMGCEVGREIEKPTPLFAASPVEYPVDMWNQDVGGSTLVRVLVNEEGGVDSVMVVEGSGHPALDSAAAQGARAMRFAPAMRGGEPLRVWARVPVHFLKDAGNPGARPPPAGEADATAGPGPLRTDGN